MLMWVCMSMWMRMLGVNADMSVNMDVYEDAYVDVRVYVRACMVLGM